MKILLQGSYRSKRDPQGSEALIRAYQEELVKRMSDTSHQLVLTSYKESDQYVADRLRAEIGDDVTALKRKLLFYLPERYEDAPEFGVVRRFSGPKYWADERTIRLLFCDVVLAIGGGRGTGDCIQKAFLSQKPVFLVHRIPGYPRELWDRMATDYHYLESGDADFITDENSDPVEFFDHVFPLLDRLSTEQNTQQLSSGNSSALPTQQFKQLVARGDLEEALDQLTALADRIDRGLHNQIIVLSGQLKRIRLDRGLGIADKSNEEARIMLAFLRILDDLEDMGK